MSFHAPPHLSPLLRTAAGALLLLPPTWGQALPPRQVGPFPDRPVAAPLLAESQVRELCRPVGEELLFDEAGDGALWARTASYKARFDGRGATVVPFFGSRAPRNFPLGLEVVHVARGGQPIALEHGSGARRSADTVRIDRGAFIEEYELTPRSLEQRFVFPTLDGAGDLIVRIAVSGELTGRDLGSSLRFEGELGHVDYSQAFALDAGGRRLALESSLVEGAIELRVPAAFVAEVALPLVIDPFITFFTVAGWAVDEFLPDVSYDASHDRWCVAWAEAWSATDYDVVVRQVSGSGSLLGATGIDISTEHWTTPALANSNYSNGFLVCAAVQGPGATWSIRGRMFYPASSTTSTVIPISPSGGTRISPDVGGDPYPDGAGFFCVVWQNVKSTLDADIEYQMISSIGVHYGIPATLDSGASWYDERPSISNSCGADNGDGLNVWTAVWQRRVNPADHDVYGAQVRWDGIVVNSMFPIDVSTSNDTAPAVSSPLDSQAWGLPRISMVVFERDFGDHDLMAAVLFGKSPYSPINLVGAFDPAYWYRDQRTPSVDSDGRQFVIGFDERNVPGGPDPDVYICSYYWSYVTNTLVPCELHAPFVASPQVEGEIVVHSMASSGGALEHFCGAWVYLSVNTGFNVQSGLWDGCKDIPAEGFCFGDGTGGAPTCPCGGVGGNGRGCPNSNSPFGAFLTSTGIPSVGAGTFAFGVSGMPLTAPCIFLQGTASIGATPFGDGLRCVGGALTRFPAKVATLGAVSYPGPGDLPIHVVGNAGAGQTTYYQTWYRDPGPICTASTFNMTNALKVTWTP